jgi:hypothetical protein
MAATETLAKLKELFGDLFSVWSEQRCYKEKESGLSSVYIRHVTQWKLYAILDNGLNNVDSD